MTNSLAPTIVRASAGTGKTYQLTARLLKVLLQGAAPESILATTFTRKAAGEILSRIMLDLANAADPTRPISLDNLRAQVGIESLTAKTAADLLAKVVRNVHRLRICTLDSLFSQLARSFAFELDLPPQWRLSDEIEETSFRGTAVAALIGRLDASQTSTLLAMLAKGDTKRSISREVIDVISSTYSLSRAADHHGWQQIKAPTSPVESEDSWDAVAGQLRDAAQQSRVKRHATKLNALANLFSDRHVEKLVDDGLVEKVGMATVGEMPVFYGKPFDPSVREPLSFLYALAKSETLGLLVGQNEATGRLLQMYAEEIEAIKRGSAALSFDDVCVVLAKGLSSLDTNLLSARMDAVVDHLLLDEFQDTSPAQWSVLRPMAIGACTTTASDADDWKVARSFFCVGDTKQAIYGWRGGVAEIFDAVSQQIPGLDERSQDKSFRSSPVITDLVTDVFRGLTNHPIADAAKHPASAEHHEAVAIRTFARRFPKHETARADLSGYFEFRTSGHVDGNSADRQSAVYKDACDLIKGLTDQSSHCIGVLTRTNDAVGQMIRRLSAMGVDVSQEGGNPLTDSAAVELVLSALLMADHPGDGRWAFHLSQTNLSTERGWTGDRIRRLIADVGMVQTIQLLADEIALGCGEHDTLRLKQLVTLAISQSRNPSGRIRDFVDLVYEKRVARPREAQVRVMTVHQSKGLEFDGVVLPQISSELVRPSTDPVADTPNMMAPPEGLTRSLPRGDWHFLSNRWRQAFGNHAAGKMNEALCLMYVAMTRAKRALYLVAEPNAKMHQRKTVAGLVCSSLNCESPGDGGRVLHQRGVANWYSVDERESVKQ